MPFIYVNQCPDESSRQCIAKNKAIAGSWKSDPNNDADAGGNFERRRKAFHRNRAIAVEKQVKECSSFKQQTSKAAKLNLEMDRNCEQMEHFCRKKEEGI